MLTAVMKIAAVFFLTRCDSQRSILLLVIKGWKELRNVF